MLDQISSAIYLACIIDAIRIHIIKNVVMQTITLKGEGVPVL